MKCFTWWMICSSDLFWPEVCVEERMEQRSQSGAHLFLLFIFLLFTWGLKIQRMMNLTSTGRGKGKNNINGATAKSPQWLELPEDIWGNILQRLGAIDILLTAQKVCTKWRRVCKEPSMWHVIDLSEWNEFFHIETRRKGAFEEMCRHLVDRSQGELVDIKLPFYAKHKLLAYVSERSGKLKRLSIWGDYSKLNLVEVVQKLSLLEELSLSEVVITTEGIEALGNYCPQLKSFKLNGPYFNSTYCYSDGKHLSNDEALAIARNLHALRHLQLIGNRMTNEGLQAILDGCPHLVSLDLRHCKNVSLDEVLRRRISRQITDVKYPHETFKFF